MVNQHPDPNRTGGLLSSDACLRASSPTDPHKSDRRTSLWEKFCSVTGHYVLRFCAAIAKYMRPDVMDAVYCVNCRARLVWVPVTFDARRKSIRTSVRRITVCTSCKALCELYIRLGRHYGCMGGTFICLFSILRILDCWQPVLAGTLAFLVSYYLAFRVAPPFSVEPSDILRELEILEARCRTAGRHADAETVHFERRTIAEMIGESTDIGSFLGQQPTSPSARVSNQIDAGRRSGGRS